MENLKINKIKKIVQFLNLILPKKMVHIDDKEIQFGKYS